MKRLDHQTDLSSEDGEWKYPTLKQLVDLVPPDVDFANVELRFGEGDGNKWVDLWIKDD